MVSVKSAQAGAEEKHDALISIEPTRPGSGIRIEVSSPVLMEFGRQIKETVNSVLKENQIEDVIVKVQDKGAMDFTIRARTETAVRRALK